MSNDARESPGQFEQAGRAGGGGERTDSWVAHLDRRYLRIRHVIVLGAGVGTEEGDRVQARDLAGEETRSASVETAARVRPGFESRVAGPLTLYPI